MLKPPADVQSATVYFVMRGMTGARINSPRRIDKDTPGIGMRSFTNLPFMV